jgi:hypothetical protein
MLSMQLHQMSRSQRGVGSLVMVLAILLFRCQSVANYLLCSVVVNREHFLHRSEVVARCVSQ